MNCRQIERTVLDRLGFCVDGTAIEDYVAEYIMEQGLGTENGCRIEDKLRWHTVYYNVSIFDKEYDEDGDLIEYQFEIDSIDF